MNTHKSFIVICALFAVMTLLISACGKSTDPLLDDTDPVLTAASDKPIVSVLGNQDVSVTPIVSKVCDDFEYPLENRTENQILPHFGNVKNGLDMCTVVNFKDADDLLARRLQQDGAIVTGRKISCVSYSKFEKTVYYEFHEGVKGDIIRYYTITLFLVENVAEGQGIKAGDIITIIEDYSFLDDGSAYQMVPLYAPPIYENEEYLIIISPDEHEYINVENAWDVRAAILIDEFSRNYEQYSLEEALRFEQKRGYFDRFDIAKEMIERFADGK